MEKSITENIFYSRGYDKGFSDAMENLASKYSNKTSWKDIHEHEPELDRLLFYSFENGDLQGIGFYFGRDEDLPESNNHVFGGCSGMMNGKVEYWMYAPPPPNQK